MKEDIEKFKNIFEGFNGGFGVFYFKDSPGPKQKGKNYTSRDSLTDSIWLNHLNGTKFKFSDYDEVEKCLKMIN